MIKFANASNLYLLIIVLLLIVFFFIFREIRKRDIKALSNPILIKGLMPELSVIRPYVKFFLLIAVVILIVFAMARPQFGSKLETVKQKNIEVMIALDISNSMLVEDVSPNRLEKAKQLLSRMVDNLENDKVGMVVFAGDAYVQLPITADRVSAKMFMSSITPKLIARQGTSIGAAIDLCMNSFPPANGAGRAIVVITDGENHEDDAIEAARQAVEKGCQVHVIGIGSVNGAPIPIAGTSNFKRDAEGNIVISKLNEQMCKEIAQAGSGIYVHADNSNSAQRIVTEELKKMSAVETEKKIYTEYEEQFQALAGIALLLLLIEFLLMDKKNKFFSKFKLFR